MKPPGATVASQKGQEHLAWICFSLLKGTCFHPLLDNNSLLRGITIIQQFYVHIPKGQLEDIWKYSSHQSLLTGLRSWLCFEIPYSQ